jgi:dihydrofolate reductase/catechol 2,3-dioxygenase-like lactoylglutathione lyase family enzyme
MEHVGIVVDDLAAATAFFVELGLKPQGEMPVEGDWVDRVVGLEGIRVDTAMMEAPGGRGGLELVKFHSPSVRGGDPDAPANTLGLRHIAFAVDDIDAAVAKCEPGAGSSLARWRTTKTSIGFATSAARRESSSSWRRRSAEGPGFRVGYQRGDSSKGVSMRRVIVQEWMTLDGVVQAPGMKDEDTRGGFEHGGWSLPYFEETSMKWVVENLNNAGGFLLGRRTYELFASHWPNASEEEQPMAEPLNSKPKYVATTTLSEPLEWENSTVLDRDVAEAVAALKKEDGDDLLVIGSTELVKTLIEHNLVDEFRVMIDPLVVGGGKRLFPEDGALSELRLLDSEPTKTGAILATYAASEN